MSKKHALLMAACCLIPIGLIVVISALAIPTSGLTSIVVALICPVMMLFMMRGMHGGHEEHHEQHAPTSVEQKQIGSSLDQ
ncbi:MAG: DUF2933 domain-containing protein [Chloroflexi bacterium]|nr:DUF2933 domain-containing protein [Chloroflexota bacterium]